MLRTIIFLLSSFFSIHSLAQPTLKDYGQLPSISNMAISPSGEVIAFLRSSDTQRFVVIYSLKNNKRLQAVDVTEVKARFLSFMNNENIFLQAGEYRHIDRYIGKHEVSGGFTISVKTGKVKQLLVPGRDLVHRGQTGLGRLLGVSKNKKYAYMPAYYGESGYVLGSYEPPAYTLLKVPTAGGRPRKHTYGTRYTIDFFLNDNDEVVAREDYKKTDKGNFHQIFAKKGRKWVEVFSEKASPRKKNFLAISQDFNDLVFSTGDQASDTLSFFKLSLKTGDITGPILPKENHDAGFAIVDQQRVLKGIQYAGFTPSYQFEGVGFKRYLDVLTAAFPGHSVEIVDYSPDQRHLIVNVSGSEQAGNYYLMSPNKPPMFLASSYSNIKDTDMNPIGRVTIRARDGLEIPTLITIPKTRVDNIKNLPAVMLPHGGPAYHDRITFDYWAQALAAEGYLVIQPQFRGSTGFGLAHKNAGKGEWGGKMQDDLSDALKFFVDNNMVDKNRVCIAGASYGGYASLAGGAFTPSLYQCVVSINGVSDLAHLLKWERQEGGYQSSALAYWKRHIGGKEFSMEKINSRSPVNFAEQFKAPSLIIFSTDDEVVPPVQSIMMAKQLKKLNKPVELVELKGDDHHLSTSPMRIKALKTAVGFINQHLKP